MFVASGRSVGRPDGNWNCWQARRNLKIFAVYREIVLSSCAGIVRGSTASALMINGVSAFAGSIMRRLTSRLLTIISMAGIAVER